MKMTTALQTCELIQFRFDSSQRKNNVLIYDSQRFSGKSSEWYFVRRNQTTRNETYRCVHCRAAREKLRRSNHVLGMSSDVISNPGARIIVRGDYFTISPDFPLGVHICDFEINENCNTHAVWCRRALLRANSELRLHPERPKLKFEKLLQSIENGEDEYAHLSTETRLLIVQQLTSKNGFDSRRRSFARNNSFGFKRLQESSQYFANEDSSLFTLKGIQNRRKLQRELLANKRARFNESFACGMPYCKLKFITETERADHRSACHSEMLFLDSYEQYEDYKKMANEVGGGLNEIIVTDNGEIVGIDKCSTDQFGLKSVDYVDESTLSNVECEVVCSSIEQTTSKLDDDTSQFPTTSDVAEDDHLDSHYFLNQIEDMLNQVRNYAGLVAHQPMRRNIFQAHVQNLLNVCQEDVNNFSHNSTLSIEQSSSLTKHVSLDIETDIHDDDVFVDDKQSTIVINSKTRNGNYCHQMMNSKVHRNEVVVHNYGEHSSQHLF